MSCRVLNREEMIERDTMIVFRFVSHDASSTPSFKVEVVIGDMTGRHARLLQVPLLRVRPPNP